MVAELIALAVMLVFAAGEWLHRKRCRRIDQLAYGPSRRPGMMGRAAPVTQVLAAGVLSWGLLTLLFEDPKSFRADGSEFEGEPDQHVILALDVSPSMRLQDAGPEQDQSRMRRASAVMRSFFSRVPVEQYNVSVVAFYTEAKPVVRETRDMEVVSNILGDLPMHYAFKKGETDLFSGLEEAANTARLWSPGSASLIVVSDGDTVPSQGMPSLPVSIADVVIVGVGDPQTGTFIDGRQSRQDASTLRQVAARLRGIYHNGNEKHLPTDILNGLAVAVEPSPLERLTRREYALIAIGLGSITLAAAPLLLHFFGTRWNPGVPVDLHQSRSNRKVGMMTNLN